MPHDNIEFDLPPRVGKDDGTPRMVGFELEFSGISLDDAAEAVQSALEGKLASESSAERVIQTNAFGEFIVELDWDFLKRKASGTDRGEEGSEWLEPLSQAAALLVPVEVVCPPIPLNDLAVLTPMVRGLREAGAVGTEESLIAAYGVHINTEIPCLDADHCFAICGRSRSFSGGWSMRMQSILRARSARILTSIRRRTSGRYCPNPNPQ